MNGCATRTFLLVILLLVLAGSPSGHATVWFTSPELRAAADTLGEFLDRQGEGVSSVGLATAEEPFKEGDWVVANHVKNRNKSVSGAVSSQDRAHLEGEGQEAFVAFNSQGIRYLVGGGHRGAVYATLKVQDEWVERKRDPLGQGGKTWRATPFFKNRIAGAGGSHPETDFSQPIPTDYDWETYARTLARYGINLTPGVVQGRVVPDDALRPWGIRKILFVSGTPFSSNELRKWRASNPGEIKISDNPRGQANDPVDWSPCPQTPFGKEVYSNWMKALFDEHKTAAAVVFFFSDWGAIPGKECAPELERWERVVSFLETLEQIARSISQNVRILASSRGFSREDLGKIATNCSASVGFYLEEPSMSLLDDPETGYDPSFATTQMAPEFVETIQEIVRTRGDEVYLAISAGDSDWSVAPTIGMALPQTTYTKIRYLVDAGARNIALAMGGFHPWVYSPSVEVFKEMVWNPDQSYEDLSERILTRDFGSAKPDVTTAWEKFEEAFSLYPSVSRVQGLGSFTTTGKGPVVSPPRPSLPKQDDWSHQAHDCVPYLLESLPAVMESWQEGVNLLRSAQELVGEESFDIAERLRDGIFWGNFYLRLLETQHNVLRCLNLAMWVPEGEDAERDPWRQSFLPVYRDEIANCQAWRDLLFAAPFSRIRVESEVTTPAAISRRFQQKQEALSSMVGE